MLETVKVSTQSRTELVEITGKVQKILAHSGVINGLCVVYVPHTTAAVTINERADPDVARDIEKVLTRLVPAGAGYRHDEGNSDAHAKAALVGSSVSVPVEDGKLALGTWQGIFLCEFDGPRNRKVMVKTISD